jgi:Tol biopolymer transport system component
MTRGAGTLYGFAWLPDGSGLLCSASRGDTMLYLPTARLWQVSLDGTMRMMTSGEVSYWYPDIARSGLVVAASVRLESDIWSFPTDGTPRDNMQHAIRITNQNSHVVTPTAGPGDREVAFVSDRGGYSNIWVIDVGSRKLRQITDERDPNVAIGVPVWSPTGDAIVFVSTRGAAPAGKEGQSAVQDAPFGPLGLWLVNPDGSNLRSLVKPGVSPYWARDGRSVYYSHTVSKGLFRVDVDGGTPHAVRTEPLRNVIGLDERTLYIMIERTRVDGLPVLEIRAANPQNGPTRLLAELSVSRMGRQPVQPTLSPDGEWIATALVDGFTTNIWTLSTSKGEWRQITNFGERPTFIARRVSWSSDGRSVLAAVSEGDADVVLLDGLVAVGRN